MSKKKLFINRESQLYVFRLVLNLDDSYFWLGSWITWVSYMSVKSSNILYKTGCWKYIIRNRPVIGLGNDCGVNYCQISTLILNQHMRYTRHPIVFFDIVKRDYRMKWVYILCGRLSTQFGMRCGVSILHWFQV